MGKKKGKHGKERNKKDHKAGLGWAGLGWAGLGWVGLDKAEEVDAELEDSGSNDSDGSRRQRCLRAWAVSGSLPVIFYRYVSI